MALLKKNGRLFAKIGAFSQKILEEGTFSLLYDFRQKRCFFKNRHFSQKSAFFTKIGVFAKNWHFCENWSFLRKILKIGVLQKIVNCKNWQVFSQKSLGSGKVCKNRKKVFCRI
jgi:hypothetical protein